MFNTMTITKAAGALIGALLFLLLASWGASAIYDMSGAQAVAEGEDGPRQAYTIEIDDAAGGGNEAEEEVDFAALLAAADPAKGAKEYGKCRACHKLDGVDGTGPHLNGVVDRAVAGVDGYAYSDAMVAHAGEAPTWSPEALYEFLTSPRGVVNGTKMAFAGIRNPEDIANLVAYLQENP